MTFPTNKVFNLPAAHSACWLLLSLAGCGEADPRASLPPQQAAAVKALDAMNVKTSIRDGNVFYVDFYGSTDAAAAAAHLKALPRAEKVNFSSTNMTDEALVHLADLAELKELALNRTKVTDKGLVHLAGLTTLQVLNLTEDNLTDAGLVHLKNLKELKQLHLNETKISDTGLQHLDGLEKLDSLLAYGTLVTPSGAAAFKERHPDVEIVAPEGETPAAAPAETPSETAPAGSQ
jgi:hypothetical protein